MSELEADLCRLPVAGPVQDRRRGRRTFGRRDDDDKGVVAGLQHERLHRRGTGAAALLRQSNERAVLSRAGAATRVCRAGGARCWVAADHTSVPDRIAAVGGNRALLLFPNRRKLYSGFLARRSSADERRAHQ